MLTRVYTMINYCKRQRNPLSLLTHGRGTHGDEADPPSSTPAAPPSRRPLLGVPFSAPLEHRERVAYVRARGNAAGAERAPVAQQVKGVMAFDTSVRAGFRLGPRFELEVGR
jgi:hypothetical protein